ncbi:hypothetical protein AHAS_Ahas06G0192900 [Arachis hypogaea]
MYVMKCSKGEDFGDGSLIPYGNIELPPSAGILNYGQIEPESQIKLLDATLNLEGVLLAGVPGAGGFDAVFVVTLGDSSSNVTKYMELTQCSCPSG